MTANPIIRQFGKRIMETRATILDGDELGCNSIRLDCVFQQVLELTHKQF
jgi:hypothetical protein